MPGKSIEDRICSAIVCLTEVPKQAGDGAEEPKELDVGVMPLKRSVPKHCCVRLWSQHLLVSFPRLAREHTVLKHARRVNEPNQRRCVLAHEAINLTSVSSVNLCKLNVAFERTVHECRVELLVPSGNGARSAQKENLFCTSLREPMCEDEPESAIPARDCNRPLGRRCEFHPVLLA